MSSQVEEAERILHEARKTSESLYGELILKTQRLVDCKANAQLWRTRYEALEEQEQLLRNEEKKLLEQCVSELTVVMGNTIEKYCNNRYF